LAKLRGVKVAVIVERGPLGDGGFGSGAVPYLAAETAGERVAVRVGEHEARRPGAVSGQVLGQHGRHHLGHRHRAETGLARRWLEFRDTGLGADELAIHPDVLAKEVHSIDRQAEALALAHPHARREDEQRPVPERDGVGQGRYVADGQWDHLRVQLLRQGDPDARRRRDKPVTDRRLEDRRNPPVRDLHRPRRKGFAQLLDPRLHLTAPDGAQRPAPECGVGVDPEVRLTLSRRRSPVHLADPPLLGVLPELRPAAGRVDVHPMCQVAAHGVKEAVGVALAVELPGLLRPAGILPPAGSVPPIGPLVDAHHEPSRTLDPVLKKSSGPQKVLSSEDYNGAIRAPAVNNGEDETAGHTLF
jgi:hypothetical protein